MYEVTATSQDAYNLFHEGTLVLSKAEQAGIRIDMEYCKNMRKQLGKQIEEKEKEFYSTKFYKEWNRRSKTPPNIYSGQQLGKHLYKNLKLKPPHTTQSGGGATDEEALNQLRIPELQLITEAKKLKKIRDTYLESFMREAINGFIHPSFNLNLVRTYRSSSQDPNFQNIPKRDKQAKKIVRDALYARKGNLLMEIDFSSIEVRIAACYHQDPTMLAYLRDPSSDMHGDMAEKIFKVKMDTSVPELAFLRSATKNGFVFPQFYGDYYGNNAISLAKQWCKIPSGKWKGGKGVDMPGGIKITDHLIANGISGMNAFTDHLKAIENHFWKDRFPVYAKWKEELWESYQKTGIIRSLTGFTYSGIMLRNEAINFPVQGSAFHCLLWSMIRINKIFREKGLKSCIIGQIHDAIVFDVVPKEKEKIIKIARKVMTKELTKHYSWINVPIDVEIEATEPDQPWSTIKKIET